MNFCRDSLKKKKILCCDHCVCVWVCLLFSFFSSMNNDYDIGCCSCYQMPFYSVQCTEITGYLLSSLTTSFSSFFRSLCRLRYGTHRHLSQPPSQPASQPANQSVLISIIFHIFFFFVLAEVRASGRFFYWFMYVLYPTSHYILFDDRTFVLLFVLFRANKSLFVWWFCIFFFSKMPRVAFHSTKKPKKNKSEEKKNNEKI